MLITLNLFLFGWTIWNFKYLTIFWYTNMLVLFDSMIQPRKAKIICLFFSMWTANEPLSSLIAIYQQILSTLHAKYIPNPGLPSFILFPLWFIHNTAVRVILLKSEPELVGTLVKSCNSEQIRKSFQWPLRHHMFRPLLPPWICLPSLFPFLLQPQCLMFLKLAQHAST